MERRTLNRIRHSGSRGEPQYKGAEIKRTNAHCITFGRPSPLHLRHWILDCAIVITTNLVPSLSREVSDKPVDVTVATIPLESVEVRSHRLEVHSASDPKQRALRSA